MSTFAAAAALPRALFALWALLLCLVNSGSAVLAAVRKRYRFSAAALLLFAPAYFLWQVIFDIALCGDSAALSGISAALGALPQLYWLLAMLLLTVAAGLLFGYNVRYDRTFITPGTVKLYLDKIPCGICCWQENGRVLFSNRCMNELCAALTQQTLLNGNQFRAAIGEDIVTVEGKVWRFVSRELELDGERLFEMIASDITKEYATTRALEKDKAELSKLNRELWEYYRNIDASVQRQEILQAKMHIHDEMNRLMLATMAADAEDTRAPDEIFSLWEQNALLLCRDAQQKQGQARREALEALAQSLGVALVWRAPLPQSLGEKHKELVLATAQEALINAVKHAQAKTLEIDFAEEHSARLCRFTNDGALPRGEVHFAGGLANIAAIAKQQGAALSTEVGEKFTLVLRIYQPNG